MFRLTIAACSDGLSAKRYHYGVSGGNVGQGSFGLAVIVATIAVAVGANAVAVWAYEVPRAVAVAANAVAVRPYEVGTDAVAVWAYAVPVGANAVAVRAALVASAIAVLGGGNVGSGGGGGGASAGNTCAPTTTVLKTIISTSTALLNSEFLKSLCSLTRKVLSLFRYDTCFMFRVVVLLSPPLLVDVVRRTTRYKSRYSVQNRLVTAGWRASTRFGSITIKLG